MRTHSGISNPQANRQVEDLVRDMEDFRKNDYKKFSESIKRADEKVMELMVITVLTQGRDSGAQDRE